MAGVRRRGVAGEQEGELQVKTSEPKDVVSERVQTCMAAGWADFPLLCLLVPCPRLWSTRRGSVAAVNSGKLALRLWQTHLCFVRI